MTTVPTSLTDPENFDKKSQEASLELFKNVDNSKYSSQDLGTNLFSKNMLSKIGDKLGYSSENLMAFRMLMQNY